MTNPTPHGQVPEALIDLIDAYAETRHRCGGIYNAKTEAARKAVIEALSGAQALSAAPEAIAKLRHLYKNLMCNGVRGTEDAKRIAQGLLAPAIEALERATPPAEQQAAPKAAPGERRNTKTHDLLSTMIGLFLGHKQAIGYKPGSVIDKIVNEAVEHLKDWPYPEAAPQQEAQEPYAYAVYFPDQPKVELVHDLDELIDDLTNRPHVVTKLYTAPRPAPDCHHRPPCDECAALAAHGEKDAG